MSTEKLFVLVIALVTWGGLFVYLLRLDKLAKRLEEQIQAHQSSKASSLTNSH